MRVPADAATQAARSSRRTQTLLVTLLFIVLTVAMTWPQARVIATHAHPHHDVYFNMWRLRWIAHALASDPAGILDGNIFHPERRTLTFSDAMLVEGTIAAPLDWAGAPPVLVHNLMMLGAIVASAVGMFVLARHLTGSAMAGVAAGIVFAFVPYRFDHIMHLELQWTVWIPWAFWAMHRTIETAERRYGVLTGVFVTLQMLSCIYYGVFLALTLGFAALALVLTRRGSIVPLTKAFAPGALVAAVVCGAYAVPYIATNREMGDRPTGEIHLYSARPSNYMVATPDNVVWGRSFAGRGRPERRLFPGALAVLLGAVALFFRRRGATPLVYLGVGVLAFELSLGFSGYTYPFLQEHVPIFRGLRAIARAGIFAIFCVGVLAALGLAALAEQATPRVRRALAIGLCAGMLLEYRVRPLPLVPYENTAPPVQAWLATQPPGVVAELPFTVPDAMPGPSAGYSYLSSFHWKPIVNGYSGYHPHSYLSRADVLKTFPDDPSLARLRADGVRYVVVHMEQYDREVRPLIEEAMEGRYGLVELGRFPGPRSEAVVWGMR
jgi:hypothetical protein